MDLLAACNRRPIVEQFVGGLLDDFNPQNPFFLPLLPLPQLLRLFLRLAHEFGDQIPRDPELPGCLLLAQMVYEVAVDDLLNLITRQLKELPLLVAVAGEFVSLLPFPDLLFQKALRVAGSGGELDLEWIEWLFFFFILVLCFLYLSSYLLVNLLPDLYDFVHQLRQTLI